MGRQHQDMDRPGVRRVSEGSGQQRKLEEAGCDVICGAPTTPAVKGWLKVKEGRLYWHFTLIQRCRVVRAIPRLRSLAYPFISAIAAAGPKSGKRLLA